MGTKRKPLQRGKKFKIHLCYLKLLIFIFLCVQILKNFDKGKCWEKGIPLCKELAEFYETKRFDFDALSEILILQAKFFQNILTQIRPEPEYFRVGFYGLEFPLFVRVSVTIDNYS